MRVFGYPIAEDRDTPFELREASLKAKPHELRVLAAFLTDVAQSMEEHEARIRTRAFSRLLPATGD